MSKSKYDKFLTVLLIIAGISVVALLIYFGYNIYNKNSSNKNAEDAVDAFQEQFISKKNNNKNNSNNQIGINEEDISIQGINNLNIENADDNPNNENSENGENTEISKPTSVSPNSNGGGTGSKKPTSGGSSSYTYTSKYAGFTMIGTIQIPKINVKCPILKELSVKSLSKATVLIYGELNQGENAVIIGHNNRNGTFFSNLKKLTNGDKITITDSLGTKINYEVYSIFQATPDDTSFYQRDTNGLNEITLSTCTDNDDSKRIIVLAREC